MVIKSRTWNNPENLTNSKRVDIILDKLAASKRIIILLLVVLFVGLLSGFVYLFYRDIKNQINYYRDSKNFAQDEKPIIHIHLVSNVESLNESLAVLKITEESNNTQTSTIPTTTITTSQKTETSVWSSLVNTKTTRQEPNFPSTTGTTNTQESIKKPTYSCQQSSVYEPAEMTNSTSSYFGYPVVQMVSCYGSRLELRCPPNQIIRIHSAFYGNQLFPNYCNPAMDSVCFRSVSADFIISTCENHTRCDLMVTERVFGVPCPAHISSNQLLIQYQCLAPNVFQEITNKCGRKKHIDSICNRLEESRPQEGLKVYEKHWCEPNTMIIECDNNTIINIICTFYGIDPILKCEGRNYQDAPTSCFSKKSMFKVSSECNGRSECSFSGEISFETDSGFTNACHGYPSMLFVQWACVAKRT